MKKLTYTLTALSVFAMNTVLFAEGEATQAPVTRSGGSDLMQTVIMIALALAFFYFIVLRPERKRRKALQEQRETLKKGDRVTAMGIVGTLAQVKEDTVVLTMIDGSKIEVLKAAISDVKSAGSEKGEEAAVEKKSS
jgi:preprotein translocase subunit YajC